MYQFISVIAGFRTQQGAAVYQAAQVERYVDDVFFAFTRGMVSVSVAACGGAILYSGFISRLKYTNCLFFWRKIFRKYTLFPGINLQSKNAVRYIVNVHLGCCLLRALLLSSILFLLLRSLLLLRTLALASRSPGPSPTTHTQMELVRTR